MSIEILKETLDVWGNKLRGDKNETNELLVDEVVKTLGYNKRLDKNVRRKVSEDVDWELIHSSGVKIAIKVYPYGEEINDSELRELEDKLKDQDYDIIIVTDGINLSMARPEHPIFHVLRCDLLNLTENSESAFNALSNEGLSLGVVDYSIHDDLLTEGYVSEFITKNGEVVANLVLDEVGTHDERLLLKVKGFVEEIGEQASKQAGLEQKQVDLEQKLEGIQTEKENLEQKLESIQTEKADLENRLVEAQQSLESVKAEKAEADKQIESLVSSQEALEASRADLEKAQTSQSELSAELDAVKEKIVVLENEKQQTSEELEAVKAEKEALERAKVELETVKAELEKKLEATQTVQESQTEASTESDAENIEAVEKISELETQLKAKNAEVEELNQRIGELTVQVKEFQSKAEGVDKHQKDNGNQPVTNAGADEDTVEYFRGKIKNLEKEREDLQDEVAVLKKQLHDNLSDSEALERLANSDNMVKVASEIAKKIGEINTDSLVSDPSAADALVAEVNALKSHIYTINLDLADASARYTKLKEQHDELERNKSDVEKQLAELQAEKEELDTQLKELTIKVNSLTSENDELKKTNQDLAKWLDEAREANHDMKEALDSGDVDTKETTELIARYRREIEDLTKKAASFEEKYHSCQDELNKANERIEELSSNSSEKAMQMLNSVVQDSPNERRAYAAVIGEEVQQYETLTKFVGVMLQKLFDLKGLEASTYIFDGDLFKISSKPVRNDVVINGKVYDIDLTGLSEDTVLNKVRILYSRFSDIPFACKKIGSLEVTREQDSMSNGYSGENDNMETYEAYEDNGTDFESGFAGDSFDGADFQSGFEDGYESSGDFEGFDEGSEDEYIDDGTYGAAETEGEDNLYYVTTLDRAVEDVEYLESQGVTLTQIRYIGSEVNSYQACWDDPVTPEELEQVGLDGIGMMAKGSNAIVAAAIDVCGTDVVTRYQEINFNESQFNGYFVSTQEDPEAISLELMFGDQWAVVDEPETMGEIIQILQNIATKLEVDQSKIWLYLDGFGGEENTELSQTYGILESEIRRIDSPMYEPIEGETPEHKLGVIQGTSWINLMTSFVGVDQHNQMIERICAVKTETFGALVHDSSDMAKVFQKMIAEAVESGQFTLEDLQGALPGSVGGAELLIIEAQNDIDIDERHVKVAPEGYFEFEVDGLKCWLCDTHSTVYINNLIWLNYTIYGNNKVAIKVAIDTKATDYYANEFTATDTYLDISVKEVAHYLERAMGSSRK